MNPADPVHSSALEELARSTARTKASTDVDFGTRWIDPASPDRYLRVTWSPRTGELSVSDATGPHVRVLAVVASRDALEQALAGWSTVGAGSSPPLSWIEKRVAQFAVAATVPTAARSVGRLAGPGGAPPSTSLRGR